MYPILRSCCVDKNQVASRLARCAPGVVSGQTGRDDQRLGRSPTGRHYATSKPMMGSDQHPPEAGGRVPISSCHSDWVAQSLEIEGHTSESGIPTRRHRQNVARVGHPEFLAGRTRGTRLLQNAKRGPGLLPALACVCSILPESGRWASAAHARFGSKSLLK